jgi:hypothetical protein
MMRVGLYRPVHVKTLRSQKQRMLLTHRKLMQSKAIAIENDLRATLTEALAVVIIVLAGSFVLGSMSSAAPQYDDQRGRENACANHVEDQQDPIACHYPLIRRLA